MSALLALLLAHGTLLAAPNPASIIEKAVSAPAKASAPNSNFTEADALEQDIKQKLAAGQKELSLVNAEAKTQTSANDRALKDIDTRRILLESLIRIYIGQLERLADINVIKQRNDATQQPASTQTAHAARQPMNFLKADELRAAMGVYDNRIAGWKAIIAKMEQEIQRRVAVNEESAAKLRQAEEELVRTRDNPGAQMLARENRQIAALQNRLDAAHLLNIEIEKQYNQQKLLETQLNRDALVLPAGNSEIYTQFTPQELATVHTDLEQRRQNILKELKTTLASLNAYKQSETTINDASATTLAPPDLSANTSDSLTLARRENLELEFQTLNFILQCLHFQEFFWKLRLDYAQIFDRDQGRVAYAQIAKGQSNIQALREYVDLRRQLTLDSIVNETKITGDSSESFQISEKNALQKLYLERVIVLSQVLANLDEVSSLVDRFKQDLDQRFQVKTFADRLQEFWLKAKACAVAVWQYEIFAAQDVVDVEGRKINIQRSITVDKIATALIILIFGYWLTARLAQLAERFAIKRFQVDASLARIARRWFLFAAFLTLLTVSLWIAYIPLTVFAFMGGALAIGTGFGMQNLLKNLISGLMLLFERPFRPGDLVEVGNIRGRIIDIGVRSSHIRDSNGIETLIPNSTFIEEQVTNWTLSSQSVRIAIKIGVAYGSPAQEVTELLLQAADRHGLVLDKPPPQVLLEDFGDNALLFGLYVWVEIKPDMDWRTVASDLRFIINKTFAANNISIAFPQRDVHIDAAKPLEICVLTNP